MMSSPAETPPDPLTLLSPDAQAQLARCLPANPVGAWDALRRLARRAGSPATGARFLEILVSLLRDAADPERALIHLERWSDSLPTPAAALGLLRENPRVLEDLLALFGGSSYAGDVLVRDPWLYGRLLEAPTPRCRADFDAAIQAAVAPLRRPEARRAALRRIKRRECLRIAWRDLARGAPLEETVQEISDLADALVAAALKLAEDELAARFPTAGAAVRFTVLALGKLGARELNYSSDIDLMFVMDSPSPQDEGHRRYATRLAETLVAILGETSSEGHCFRVDLRLRPEGRLGALVRSLAGFRAYYDRWAETWERQALIKVRPIAGCPELGQRFLALVQPFVYRRLQGASLLEDVRQMREAVERKLDAAGEMDAHVKEGRGTIRDVEFAAQLLQLLFGGDRPSLQVRDTLTALRRLAEAGCLDPDERRVLE